MGYVMWSDALSSISAGFGKNVVSPADNILLKFLIHYWFNVLHGILAKHDVLKHLSDEHRRLPHIIVIFIVLLDVVYVHALKPLNHRKAILFRLQLLRMSFPR